MTWPTTPSILHSSRCWPCFLFLPSVPSCLTVNGTSTTSTSTARALSMRSCVQARCTESRSRRAWCRCSSVHCSHSCFTHWHRGCSVCGPASSQRYSGCSIQWSSGWGTSTGSTCRSRSTTALVSLAMVRWLKCRDRRSWLWLGASCGLVVSAQVTGLLVVAVACATVLVAQARAGKRGWQLWRLPVCIALITWVFVWIVYIVLDPSVVLDSWFLLPHPFVEGVKYLGSNDTGSSPGFLLGQRWDGANVWFWPASLLVKLTAPILVLLIAGPLVLVAGVRSGRVSRSTLRQTLMAVVLPALVLFVFELPNPRTLGVRYLLPCLALWTVVASPIALLVGRRLMAAALTAVMGVAAALTALSFPDSIAYTAAPFTPAYRVATDSNVDWGQDFSLLVDWSRGRHPRVAYFGPRGITNADIPGARRLIGVAPGTITGWVAASASDLTSALRDDALSWLRAYCPVATLGGSILLYHFATPPTAAPGPSTPAPLCNAGATSRRVIR